MRGLIKVKLIKNDSHKQNATLGGGRGLILLQKNRKRVLTILELEELLVSEYPLCHQAKYRRFLFVFTAFHGLHYHVLSRRQTKSLSNLVQIIKKKDETNSNLTP